MKSVWKYVVPVDDKTHEIIMPTLAEIVHVGNQEFALGPAKVVMWAEVDPEQESERRLFHVVGTGHPIPERATYRGTTMVGGGQLVWHLYEVLS